MRNLSLTHRPIALALLALTVGIVGCRERVSSTTVEPNESGPRSIFALGTLQPSSGVIAISGTPGDRLKAIDPDVIENGTTPANGVLGVLASYDARLAQLEALRTRQRLAEEKQQVDLLLAQAQLRGAQAKVKEAEARYAEAQLQGEQVEHLKESAAIAQDELESITALRESDPELVTTHQVRKQRNRVARAESDVKLAAQRIGPMTAAAAAAVDAARANLEAAEVSVASLKKQGAVEAIAKEVAVAEQAALQSILWAPGADASLITLDENPAEREETPASGSKAGRFTVLKVFTKPGELVSQLPVMHLADVSQIECIAEVYEADAQNIRVGQTATITSPALSDKLSDGLRGKVTYVASTVGSPSLDARNPLAPKDRSIVEVRIGLTSEDKAILEEAASRIGLQVTVRFDAE